MKSKQLGAQSRDGLRSLVLVFDTGDEVMETLTGYAAAHGIEGAHFTAIGAFERAVLGYFDWRKKEYERIPVDDQVEVLTLAGDIALDAGRPKVHAHVVLGERDGRAVGGHLIAAIVRPTLEMMVTELAEPLRRRSDPETGLALIRF
jgi:predicted DNA-binding protein with PD1-like motif